MFVVKTVIDHILMKSMVSKLNIDKLDTCLIYMKLKCCYSTLNQFDWHNVCIIYFSTLKSDLFFHCLLAHSRLQFFIPAKSKLKRVLYVWSAYWGPNWSPHSEFFFHSLSILFRVQWHQNEFNCASPYFDKWILLFF